MTTFIIAAAIITLIVLGLLIWPLKRTRNTISYERHAQNIHYAKERIQELEAQLKNAAISATDYEALKLEIESTLAHDIDIANQEHKNQQDAPRRSNKFAISLLCLFVPMSAIGMYMVTGTPEALSPQTQQQPNAEEISVLIANIEQRLEDNPNDLKGWKLISRTYQTLGRYGNAKQAYLRVLALEGESADTYASLADVTALNARGEVNAEATQYAMNALKLAPNSKQALWLIGLGAMQKGNKAEARGYWERLVPLLDSVPEQQQELRDIIAQSVDQPSISTQQKQTAALETKNKQNNTASQQSHTQSAGISVSVRLDPSLIESTSPTDSVFVFARAQQGPRAPLAVKRLTVADLPLTIELSDSDAMMAQFKLSLFEDVVVSARVSKSGQPIAQSGDFQSDLVDSKNSNSDTIELVISRVVE